MSYFKWKFLVCFVLTLLLLTTQSTYAQNTDTSGHIDWGDWSFDYESGVFKDGLAIKNVTFRNKEILGRGSFPVMPVFYENTCGPFYDRLDGELQPVPWANDAKLVAREFTINGEQWYELGTREFIGSYDIYQVWYFNDQGIIDAHLFSRGVQCNIFHEHFPYWRFDFDLSGNGDDQIQKLTNNGYVTMTSEFNQPATNAVNHGWRVKDSMTGHYADLTFDSGQWNVTGTIIPETNYANNYVGGVLFDTNEKQWDFSTVNDIPFVNSENIDAQDVVLWYTGYMPHTVEEGADLWHSTGVRINIGPSKIPTAVSFSNSNLNGNLTLLLIPILLVGISTAYIFIRRRQNAL